MSLTNFKEIQECVNSRFTDSPLGKMAEEKTFDKPVDEYDKPLSGDKRIPNSDHIGNASWGSSEIDESAKEKLNDVEKTKIKEEKGWSNEIIGSIQNMEQYGILKDAGLKESEINGRKCLIKEDINLDYSDSDGISNRERVARGLAPLDSKTGKPLELHHLGQKVDSPLVELTEEEHRTGEYEDGKKNQSLWHDNAITTEVHGEGNNWDQERKAHWKARSEQNLGGSD